VSHLNFLAPVTNCPPGRLFVSSIFFAFCHGPRTLRFPRVSPSFVFFFFHWHPSPSCLRCECKCRMVLRIYPIISPLGRSRAFSCRRKHVSAESLFPLSPSPGVFGLPRGYLFAARLFSVFFFPRRSRNSFSSASPHLKNFPFLFHNAKTNISALGCRGLCLGVLMSRLFLPKRGLTSVRGFHDCGRFGPAFWRRHCFANYGDFHQSQSSVFPFDVPASFLLMPCPFLSAISLPQCSWA